MKDIQADINKIIEKLIKTRIDDVILKGNLNEIIGNQIKDINGIIAKETKNKKIKKNKKLIPKDKKILNKYTLYIKDATTIIKENPNLNYLPNDIIDKIKSCKNDNAKDQFKVFSSIWKELDNNIKSKYKELCQNKDFTNDKYTEIIEKSKTHKTLKKRKSKESLKA